MSDEAAKNVAAIRGMIAQNDSWRSLQSSAPKRATKAKPLEPLEPPQG